MSTARLDELILAETREVKKDNDSVGPDYGTDQDVQTLLILVVVLRHDQVHHHSRPLEDQLLQHNLAMVVRKVRRVVAV